MLHKVGRRGTFRTFYQPLVPGSGFWGRGIALPVVRAMTVI
jgi:hypothetical protein